MRDYEAMVIVDARLEEGDIQKAIERFVSQIGEVGGQPGTVDRWGNRRFALRKTIGRHGLQSLYV
jgi:ribosomal protein S6